MRKITSRRKSEIFLLYCWFFNNYFAHRSLHSGTPLLCTLLLSIRVMFWSPSSHYNPRCLKPTSTLVLLASVVSRRSNWTARSTASASTPSLNCHVSVRLIDIWSCHGVSNGCRCYCSADCLMSGSWSWVSGKAHWSHDTRFSLERFIQWK